MSETTVDKKLAVGDKVWFEHEKQGYTVRAVTTDGRFAICTKPFNLRKTVLYCIIDYQRGVRGPDNLVFGHGYETPEQIEDARLMLERGEMEVSYRTARHLPLVIARHRTLHS